LSLSGLIGHVQTLSPPLNRGELNSLLRKLWNAQAALNRGQTNAACGLLGAFAAEVGAMVHSFRLTQTQAAPLLASVVGIRSPLACRN
jgi:hypothetical protein